MKVLVISDTHGSTCAIRKILERHQEILEVFFLGDNVNDALSVAEDYPVCRFHIIAGNCDPFSTERGTDIVELGGVSIFCTHGQHYGVKSGYGVLADAARERGCRLALCGHTHIAHTEYADGITVVNPGSAAFSRNGPNTYAVVEILPQGILSSIMFV